MRVLLEMRILLEGESNKHIEDIQKGPSFFCPTCKSSFWSINRLNYHIYEIHEKPKEQRKKMVKDNVEIELLDVDEVDENPKTSDKIPIGKQIEDIICPTCNSSFWSVGFTVYDSQLIYLSLIQATIPVQNVVKLSPTYKHLRIILMITIKLKVSGSAQFVPKVPNY